VDVELRHLRSFVAVAEHLNFTRASKQLFVAQQALSAQIRQLEDRIGVRLLERSSRSVSLTPAGEVLYAQARLLLSGAEDAIAATRASAAGSTTITVGFVAAVDHPAVSHALDRFGEAFPDVELRIHFGDLLDPTGGLRDRAVDVAFVYGPFDATDLEVTPLFVEAVGIAMAAAHPLASKEELTVADLVAQPTFDFPTTDPAWRDYWNVARHRGPADRPRYVAQYRTLEGLITALRAGLGVHLATAGLVESAGTGLVWRQLDDVEPLEHSIARRASDDRPHVQALIATTASTFQPS
jgi:DNA-binding transcriptional LysR family regulator